MEQLEGLPCVPAKLKRGNRSGASARCRAGYGRWHVCTAGPDLGGHACGGGRSRFRGGAPPTLDRPAGAGPCRTGRACRWLRVSHVRRLRALAGRGIATAGSEWHRSRVRRTRGARHTGARWDGGTSSGPCTDLCCSGTDRVAPHQTPPRPTGRLRGCGNAEGHDRDGTPGQRGRTRICARYAPLAWPHAKPRASKPPDPDDLHALLIRGSRRVLREVRPFRTSYGRTLGMHGRERRPCAQRKTPPGSRREGF